MLLKYHSHFFPSKISCGTVRNNFITRPCRTSRQWVLFTAYWMTKGYAGLCWTKAKPWGHLRSRTALSYEDPQQSMMAKVICCGTQLFWLSLWTHQWRILDKQKSLSLLTTAHSSSLTSKCIGQLTIDLKFKLKL